ncbi:MAG: hypothetical protein ACI9JM_000523 [Halioglobus sp.]|jgi:hypothetical protein
MPVFLCPQSSVKAVDIQTVTEHPFNTIGRQFMTFKSITVVTALLLLTACGQAPQPATAVAEPPYQAITNIHQTMEWILDPAADLIWGSAGTIITAEGHHELAPTTDEGWAEVLHAAATLTEAGNLLMMPGRAAGDDWIEYSQGLIAAGQLAITAAQDQDDKALFEAGGRLYQVCRACHNQYWIEEEDEHEDEHPTQEQDH